MNFNDEIEIVLQYLLPIGVWSSPPVTGTRPPPCAYASLTTVDDHRAVLFGSQGQGREYVNDVYRLDLLAEMVSCGMWVVSLKFPKVDIFLPQKCITIVMSMHCSHDQLLKFPLES